MVVATQACTRKILIVDDDVDFCRELASLLGIFGYFAKVANCSSQAECLLEQEEFQLLLVDYKMAGTNGIEFIRQARAKRSRAKVMLLTGQPGALKLAHESGIAGSIDDIIGKPFNVDLLLKRITKLCE